MDEGRHDDAFLMDVHDIQSKFGNKYDEMKAMKANEFVERLKEVTPAKTVLIKCGYGGEEADKYIRSFACPARSEPLGIETLGDASKRAL